MAQPLTKVAPTTTEVLRTCGLRVALSQTRPHAGSNPWARLGSACHAVYEAAALGELGEGGEDFGDRFEAAWRTAVERQMEESRRYPAEATWGDPEHWPGYNEKRARLRRRARELAAKVHAWADADLLVESVLEPDGDVLYGKPDLIVRHPAPHRVEDYKSGVVEDEQGAIKGAYRRQILLYAYLESVVSGKRPELGVVVPLKGEERRLEIDWDDVESTVSEAHGLIAEFNRNAESPLALARPGAVACSVCPYAAECPAFWAATKSIDGSELLALEGAVVSTQVSELGAISAEVHVHGGSISGGPALLHRFPLRKFPSLSNLKVGSQVRVVGARPAKDDDRTILPAGWTRATVVST